MSQAKQLSKRKRSSKAVPLLGAAGLLALASGASAEALVDTPTPNTGVSQQVFLGEEEIADVSLATFYVFDKENLGTFRRRGVRFAVGAGGGCWTGTYYTSSGSGNNAYPPRPARPARAHASKHAPKS
jgi:hypothetical protein